MTIYDARLSDQTMQEPITDEAATHHRALPTDHVQPTRASPRRGQPYGRTIGADLFQLGSLGQAQTSTAQIPNPNP